MKSEHKCASCKKSNGCPYKPDLPHGKVVSCPHYEEEGIAYADIVYLAKNLDLSHREKK